MGSPDDRRAGALLLREGARRLSQPTQLFIPQFEPNWADFRLNSVRWPGWPLQMLDRREVQNCRGPTVSSFVGPVEIVLLGLVQHSVADVHSTPGVVRTSVVVEQGVERGGDLDH